METISYCWACIRDGVRWFKWLLCESFDPIFYTFERKFSCVVKHRPIKWNCPSASDEPITSSGIFSNVTSWVPSAWMIFALVELRNRRSVEKIAGRTFHLFDQVVTVRTRLHIRYLHQAERLVLLRRNWIADAWWDDFGQIFGSCIWRFRSWVVILLAIVPLECLHLRAGSIQLTEFIDINASTFIERYVRCVNLYIWKNN